MDDMMHGFGVDVVISPFEVSKDYVGFEAVAEAVA
jgi:hypothetical protein